MWYLGDRWLAVEAYLVFPASRGHGFKLDGENNGITAAIPSARAGDINGDGYGDLADRGL